MRQQSGAEGERVLLVEDETRLRDVLLRAMAEMGFVPEGCASAEQASRLMERRPFPVVVVDLNLPGAGGMDLVATIRRLWPATQAVILTGFGDLDAARKAIHLDVVDFLAKPCALGDLEVALGRAFQRARPGAAPARVGRELREPNPAAGTAARVTKWERTDRPPAALEFTPREGSTALHLEAVERQTILAALEKHGDNRIAAAAELGISLRKLYYRLAQYQKQGLPLP